MKLNQKLTHLTESLTLQLNASAAALQNKGIAIINLTAGELDFETPLPIRRSVQRMLQQNRYTATAGLSELRTAISLTINHTRQLHSSAANIVVTAGAKQALAEITQAIMTPGDEVIILTPSWVSYEHQVRLAGGTPVFVALDPVTFDLDVAAIKKALTRRTKAIILNSPHNPTGAVFSQERLSALEKMFRRKNIFVIVDDIYRELAYSADFVSPATIFARHPSLIIVDGFSKSHALTGWRIGYCVAPIDVVRAITAYQSHTSGNASLPSQYAALACLQSPTIPKTFVHALKKRRDLVHQLLATIPGITWTKPEGAFYFFINIKQIEKSSIRFCEQLLKSERVALVPGEAFRAPGFIRLSFTASERNLRTALRRLKMFIETYA